MNGIDAKCQRLLMTHAKLKFQGNEYRFRRINIFEPAELIQEFYSQAQEKFQNKDDKLIFGDFKNFIIDQIRKAEAHKRSDNNVYTFTDLVAQNNYLPDSDYMSFDDRIDASLARRGVYEPQETKPIFRVKYYRSSLTGGVYLNSFVWYVKRVMCRHDRFWKCANNYEYYYLKDKKTPEIQDGKFEELYQERMELLFPKIPNQDHGDFHDEDLTRIVSELSQNELENFLKKRAKTWFRRNILPSRIFFMWIRIYCAKIMRKADMIEKMLENIKDGKGPMIELEKLTDLKDLLPNHRVNQAEIAEKLGINQSTISRALAEV